MWNEFATVWLPNCECPWDRPENVLIDGHSTYLRSKFKQLVTKYGLHVVVDPSHTSMILLFADVGVNRFHKSIYEREYTASLSPTFRNKKAFDDTKRIVCLVRTELNSFATCSSQTFHPTCYRSHGYIITSCRKVFQKSASKPFASYLS